MSNTKKEILAPSIINDSKYINRELSWIDFNKRVLYQSLRNSIPLFERAKFLAITESNLNEFIMVRLSSVINRLNKNNARDISGMKPNDEYTVLLQKIKEFKSLQYKVYSKLKTELNITKVKNLKKNDMHKLSKLFFDNIYPLLVPITYDTTTEFPDLKSGQINIVCILENQNTNVLSFVPIPDMIPKMICVGDNILSTVDVILHYLDRIFIGKNILEYGTLKLLRNCDIELNHNTDIYIVDRMKSILHQREVSLPVFMDTSNLSKPLIKILCKLFNLPKNNTYTDAIDYTMFFSLPKIQKYMYPIAYPQNTIDTNIDMFKTIQTRDILLHHPYDSFTPVIKLLEHSAYDENVLTIKQTLYRVSSINSPIINALCTAAKNGKQVTVMLELKARFDEGQNISIVNKLKSSGCNIIYGIEELKTHAKFIIITRKEKDKIKIYSHIGTGNYNDKTAKQYTDMSYFTSDFKIGEDLTTIFNMLSGFSEPNNKINRIFFSPFNLRKKLYNMIDGEIKNVEKGKKGTIILKMNSLSDKEFIDKLYYASKKGVKIVIFCRGICSMKPINDNIFIRSLIGRYLEHSRIYYFSNNGDPEVFISSADLLTRNLDKRVEVLFPITDEETKEKLLKILLMYYKDNTNTFVMNKTGEYKRLKCGKKKVNIHEEFMIEAIENIKSIKIPKMIKHMKKQ